MVERTPANAVDNLLALGLTLDQVESLKRQGFVARETRGSGRPYFKLRFRSRGKQVVRYLGSDVERAARVAAELQELQTSRRLDLELSRVIAEAARMLRVTKSTSRTALVEQGFTFHGYDIRRNRSTHESKGSEESRT